MSVSAIDDLHVGDEGTIIRLEFKDGASVVDISTATVWKIKFKKPSGVVVTKDAVFTTDGSDGLIQYVTEAGAANILDEAGEWEIQGYIEMPSWKGHSETIKALVRDNLS